MRSLSFSRSFGETTTSDNYTNRFSFDKEKKKKRKKEERKREREREKERERERELAAKNCGAKSVIL